MLSEFIVETPHDHIIWDNVWMNEAERCIGILCDKKMPLRLKVDFIFEAFHVVCYVSQCLVVGN